jgi:ribonuclease HI
MKARRLNVYFDGGCRPNPVRIEVAVMERRGVRVFEDLGHGMNGDAEWQALIHEMHLSQALGLCPGAERC